MERPRPEFTIICIDNSSMVFKERHTLLDQVDAVKFYCKTLFERNSDSAVMLYLMTKTVFWMSPTRDLQEISRNLENVPCFGHLKFVYALAVAAAVFKYVPPNMDKRLLVFVASPIDVDSETIHPKSTGKALGQSGVDLHVFKYPISKSKPDIEKRMRDYINLVVTSTVKDGGEGSLMDVNAPLIDMLNQSVLEKNLHYISKVAGNEMNRAPAGVRDTELTDISHISKRFGLEYESVYIPPDRIPTVRIIYPKVKETQKVSKGDASVKQELLLSCNEKNKIYSPPCAEEDVSAEKAEEDASVKQGSCNEKNKIYSPPCAEEDVSVTQGSCNEKNKAAAQGICNECVEPKLLSRNEKNKAAAPGICKCSICKEFVEPKRLSRNEKNKAAAQGICNKGVEPKLLSGKKKIAQRHRKK